MSGSPKFSDLSRCRGSSPGKHRFRTTKLWLGKSEWSIVSKKLWCCIRSPKALPTRQMWSPVFKINWAAVEPGVRDRTAGKKIRRSSLKLADFFEAIAATLSEKCELTKHCRRQVPYPISLDKIIMIFYFLWLRKYCG